MTIRRKKSEKQIELRAAVAHLRSATAADRRTVPDALASGLPELTVSLGLRLEPGIQIRPVEVLRAVLSTPELELAPVDLVRTGFWSRSETGLRSPLEPLLITADS